MESIRPSFCVGASDPPEFSGPVITKADRNRFNMRMASTR